MGRTASGLSSRASDPLSPVLCQRTPPRSSASSLRIRSCGRHLDRRAGAWGCSCVRSCCHLELAGRPGTRDDHHAWVVLDDRSGVGMAGYSELSVLAAFCRVTFSFQSINRLPQPARNGQHAWIVLDDRAGVWMAGYSLLSVLLLLYGHFYISVNKPVATVDTGRTCMDCFNCRAGVWSAGYIWLSVLSTCCTVSLHRSRHNIDMHRFLRR